MITDKTRNPYEIAQHQRITIEEAQALLRDDLEYLAGWGKVRLQKYIISRKSKSGSWPDGDRIFVHQRMHDRGETTVCQAHDDRWIILYSIPCKKKVVREPYFTRTEYT